MREFDLMPSELEGDHRVALISLLFFYSCLLNECPDFGAALRARGQRWKLSGCAEVLSEDKEV